MFQKGLRWLLMCAPLLKLDDFFTTAYMCHVMKPCQVSCFLGDFLIYWDLKTKIPNVSGRPQVCNSFPFLKWDLNMHPMTHVRFPTHFASLEHVVVVQIWIMDYIKCIENLVISNIYTMAKRTLNSFKFQPDTPVILCACRKQSSRREEASIIVSPTRGACFPTRTTRVGTCSGL